MNLIDRYVMRVIVTSTMLVLLVLLAISAFIAFVGDLDNVGKGAYGMTDAVVFVLMLMPKLAYEMFPVAALIGALMGLGTLASHSELIVMRAAGVSRIQLARSVGTAGLILFIVAAALGEFIAPSAEQYATRERALNIYEDVSDAGSQGSWMRDGTTIVNVQQLAEQERLGAVFLFEFDASRQLSGIARARSAGFDEGDGWRLENVSETEFSPSAYTARSEFRRDWETSLNPELLGLFVIDPDSQSSQGLYKYVQYLKHNELDSHRYEVAFWMRASNVVSVLLMTLLALPFVFGSLRRTGSGQRLLVGVLIGIAYYLGSKTLAGSGEVYGLNPVVTAWLPTALLALVTLLGIARSR